MPISALPPAPSPSDTPLDFNNKAFTFLGALSTFRTEANALETAVDADAVTASTAAGTATTQAGIATTKAGEALASANAAAQSASDASGAASSAISAFDQFDDRYLGAKANDPTTDNDGNALLQGALYYRIGDGMRVWSGSAWAAAYLPASGYATLTGTETLTNKTISGSNNTITNISLSTAVTGTLPIGSGGTGATTAPTARTNLGATTVGSNIFTLADPSAITFLRVNADNTVSALDAATFRTAIGAGSGSGDVVGQASSVDNEIALFSGTGGKTIKRATTTGVLKATSGVIAAAVANTDYVAPAGADGILSRWMFQDTGWDWHDSATTNALNYVNGSVQRWAPNTGAQTLSITNWPPTGNLGELLIEGVNLGAATITWPTINWINPDGTTTTTISTYLTNISRSLRTSGIDFVFLWTRDAGTTIYGKLI